jgi:hypothetical protein
VRTCCTYIYIYIYYIPEILIVQQVESYELGDDVKLCCCTRETLRRSIQNLYLIRDAHNDDDDDGGGDGNNNTLQVYFVFP